MRASYDSITEAMSPGFGSKGSGSNRSLTRLFWGSRTKITVPAETSDPTSVAEVKRGDDDISSIDTETVLSEGMPQ